MNNVNINNSSKKNSRNSFLDEVLSVLETIAIAFLLVLVIFTFIFRVVIVEGNSMNPTLSSNDKLFVSHIFTKPDNGDIVVINSKGLNKTIIKRVIATEGQTVKVDYKNSEITVDGEIILEDYIKEDMRVPTYGDVFLGADKESYTVTVPEGYVFVLGDNRNASADSRDGRVGFVPLDEIVGKAWLRFMPLDVFGLL